VSATIRRVVQGSSWLIASNVAGKLIHMLLVMTLIRGLGVSEYGLLMTVWGVAQLTAGALDLGMSQVIVRDGARHEAMLEPLVRFVLRVRLPMSMAALAAVTAFASTAVDYDAADETVPLWVLVGLVAAFPIIDSWHLPFANLCHVAGRFRRVAFYRVMVFASILTVVGALVVVAPSLTATAVAYVLVATTAVVWFIRGCLPLVPKTAGTDLSLGVAVRRGLPFMWIGILMMGYMRLELLVLGTTLDTEAAGVYGAQYQIILLAFVAPSLVYQAMMPHVYRVSHDRQVMRDTFTKLVRYLNLYGLISAVLVVLLADQLLRLVGGAELAEHRASLEVLSMMFLLLFSTAALNVMNALDLLRERIAFEAVGLAFLAVAGYLAAARYGVTGMAVAAVAAYGITALLSVLALARRGVVDFPAIAKDAIRSLFAALPAAGAVTWFGLPPLVAAPTFVVLLVGGLSLLRFWNNTDVAVARSYLSMFKRPA